MSALRILLVDDDEANRFTLAALLEDAGFVVREAATMDEAKEALLEETGWALVLADYHLAEGLGIELLPLVRERLPGARFVLVSGDEGAADLPGVDGMLRKGDDPKRALARIAAWLGVR